MYSAGSWPEKSTSQLRRERWSATRNSTFSYVAFPKLPVLSESVNACILVGLQSYPHQGTARCTVTWFFDTFDLFQRRNSCYCWVAKVSGEWMLISMAPWTAVSTACSSMLKHFCVGFSLVTSLCCHAVGSLGCNNTVSIHFWNIWCLPSNTSCPMASHDESELSSDGLE